MTLIRFTKGLASGLRGADSLLVIGTRAAFSKARLPDALPPSLCDLLIDLVSDLIEEGEFMKDDPLEVTLTIWSLCHGYAALYLAGRFGDHPNRFRRLSRAALRRMLEGLLA